MDAMVKVISNSRLNKLAYYAMLLVALACLAYTLASSFWLLMSVVQADNQSVASPARQHLTAFNKPQSSNAFNINSVGKLYLFGKPANTNVKTDSSKLANIVAPETKLNLKLMGLRRGSGTISSSAIVEGPDKKQNIYFIGDTLPSGNAVVEEIYIQHMIISRQGKYETLTLFSVLNSKSETKVAKPALAVQSNVTDLSDNRFITTKLNKYKDIAFKEPTALIGIVNVEPVTKGDAFVGYKVSPGIDSALFVRAGLQRGDVITSINGVTLDSPNKALTLMGSLTFTDDLEITVDRAGKPNVFKYSF